MESAQDHITVDLSSATGSCDVHAAFASALAFPDFYGYNWDAFWDAITCLVEMPRKLTVRGWARLERVLPRDARLLSECLSDMKRKCPDIACDWELID
jgi:RNAse (barnase) inhibitor barstar